MTEPDLDKIRRAAELVMKESAAGNDHLAYLYAAWIREHLRDILYEDCYQPPLGLC